jgi:integrase
MGHASIQVTVDVYGHLVPGGNREAVDRLDMPLATRSNPVATDESNAVPSDVRNFVETKW